MQSLNILKLLLLIIATAILPISANPQDAEPWLSWRSSMHKDHPLTGKIWSVREKIFVTPQNLGKAVNTPSREFDAFIAPDESCLVFSSDRRGDGFGKSDLYISFRKGEEKWTQAVNMGPLFNSRESEFTPIVTPDGRYFFFTSTKLGQADIYWVDAAVLDRYRPGKEGS